jgi:type II secretory pathway pseudopilin PulG
MVELLVAITVFALVFAAVSVGIGRALDLNRSNRNRSAGAYLAAKQLEEVRSTPFAEVAVGRTTCVFSAPSGTCNVPSPYTVVQEVAWASPGSTSTSCGVPSGSGAALAYKRVTVTVTWPDMGGVDPVTSQTLLTPPGGTYDPNDGHVVVQVFDRNALPLAGQTVALSGPEAASVATDADGCAFFAYLDPGTYTASLATSGHVDRQGNQPASQTVGVIATQIARLQFDYDRAATLAVTVAVPTGSNAVIPSGIPLTVANNQLTVGKKSFQESSTGSGTVRSVTPLFPYLSGYQVWAGDCAAADPAAYSGGSRGATVATTPGASSPATVNLDAVEVLVTRLSGTPVANSNVTVQATHAADSGCASGELLTASTRTDASGRFRLALPYGTWSIRTTTTTGSPSRTGISVLPTPLDPVLSLIPTLVVVVV